MKFDNYYSKNITFISRLDYRLTKILDFIWDSNPKNILDVGCGDGFFLKQIQLKVPRAKLTGVDVYNYKKILSKKGINYIKCDITQGLPFIDESFDCVILGEIIEHVPNTDFLLRETNRILKKNGNVIISTPNLACWVNRILLILGIQPLFTETSMEIHIGRVFKILGQGNTAQGHLKIFTKRSMDDFLKKEKFKVIKRIGVTFFFPFPITLIDRFFANFVSLSSGFIYIASKK